MHPILVSIGSFNLPTYGVLLVLAILSGILTAMSLGRRAGLDSGQVLDFCTWIILVALVGAKVLMILADWSYYRANPREIFSLSTLLAGGVFYGGFLAALFFVIWYVRVQKLSFWKMADVLAPAVAVGQSIGRLGCFNAGCDYGTPTHAWWGVVFSSTFAHQVTGVPLGIRLHPTQLYESFATFVIFGILLWRFSRRRWDGEVFLSYVSLYAVARFFLEFLRGDEDRGFVFHHLLSTSQFIALLALAGVAIAMIWRQTHHSEAPAEAVGGRGDQPVRKAGSAARPESRVQASRRGGVVPGAEQPASAAAPAPKPARR